ncbi:hypothetical protein [Psychrobacter nivimaris]|uniref:hypothetical protein n=1 Tax=Psychrobacter nivimaris TaxID=281738 RepID=UPI00191A6710|nr:hypothetical protein [Psychrobacter nivimaris]
MSDNYVNPNKINRDHAVQLADLFKEKEALIGDMRRAQDSINNGAYLRLLDVSDGRILQNNSIVNTPRLTQSLEKNADWIIDRVYDQAISEIEREIANIATLLLENLIEANEIPF